MDGCLFYFILIPSIGHMFHQHIFFVSCLVQYNHLLYNKQNIKKAWPALYRGSQAAIVFVRETKTLDPLVSSCHIISVFS